LTEQCNCQWKWPEITANDFNTSALIHLWPFYRSTCISQYPHLPRYQLEDSAGAKFMARIPLLTWSLAHSVYEEDAAIFLNAHTHNHFTTLDFVRDNPGELVPEETFTHSFMHKVSNLYIYINNAEIRSSSVSLVTNHYILKVADAKRSHSHES